jgi:hypothetical protein
MADLSEKEVLSVPRSRVFVLSDGTFVVQWEENRVQALLSGRYFSYSAEQFGNTITDYELNQLKNTGAVVDYDDDLVYLSAMIDMSLPKRSYYLNTTLLKDRVQDVQQRLEQLNLAERYAVRLQDVFVIVRSHAGTVFGSFDEAERARELLAEHDPDIFGGTVVAFVEVSPMQW